MNPTSRIYLVRKRKIPTPPRRQDPIVHPVSTALAHWLRYSYKIYMYVNNNNKNTVCNEVQDIGTK
jgi:hypothetical protein